MFINKISHTNLAISIIVLGCGLRLFHYMMNYSLWYDEASLALAIINTPLNEIHLPLFNRQIAPLGYLYFTKILTILLSENEFTLRIASILGGISLLPIIFFVSRKLFDKKTACFTLFIAAINLQLINFSVELKPYIIDALTALLILLASIHTLTKDNYNTISLGNTLFLSFVLIASMWVSFSAVFVSVGIMVAAWIIRLTSGNKKIDRNIAILTLLITGNILFLNFFHLNNIRHTTSLHAFWEHNFVPFPVSFDALKWILYKPFSIINYPAGYYFSGLTCITICIGISTLWKISRPKVFIITLPVIVTIGASLFRKYPFEGRLILFIVPSIIILSGSGLVYLYQWIKDKNITIAYCIIFLYLLFPLYDTVQRTLRPFRNENSRPVIQYVLNNKQPDHEIYVYYGAIAAFTYYSKLLHYNGKWIKGTEGRDNWNKYGQEIEELFQREKKPIWFIFSHIWDTNGVNEEKYFISNLNKIAVKKDYIHAIGGASAYLYIPKGMAINSHGK